jgi:hypothetical protein
VCVAAGLHANAGGRRARQIRGHHRGSASQERERIGAHPSIADRQQFLDSALALFDQNFDRIGPVGRLDPFAERAARHFAAERCSSLPALVRIAGRQRLVPVGKVGIHAVIILSYAAGCTCCLAQQAYSTPYEDFTEAMGQKLTLGDQGPDGLA